MRHLPHPSRDISTCVSSTRDSLHEREAPARPWHPLCARRTSRYEIQDAGASASSHLLAPRRFGRSRVTRRRSPRKTVTSIAAICRRGACIYTAPRRSSARALFAAFATSFASLTSLDEPASSHADESASRLWNAEPARARRAEHARACRPLQDADAPRSRVRDRRLGGRTDHHWIGDPLGRCEPHQLDGGPSDRRHWLATFCLI